MSQAIIDIVRDSEINQQSEVQRTFVYNLSDKAAKAKLLKGAKGFPLRWLKTPHPPPLSSAWVRGTMLSCLL